MCCVCVCEIEEGAFVVDDMVVATYRWPAICIHGDKAQQEREWVLEGEAISEGCSIAVIDCVECCA